ncbi:MAG: hypothetical protein KTR25_00290 [Myxococcales bacterium]|nr:hypothetical protein [Myxococcales bacterium]
MRRTIQLLQRLAHNDARLILRDGMLALLSIIALLMGIGARFALPAIDASLSRNLIYNDFASTYPMWVTFIALWQASLMCGTVFGFLLLDEKEDRTMTAMRVSPVPFELYVGYRVALPAIFAFVLTIVLVPLIGIANVAWWKLMLFAIGASITAPLVAMFFAGFADNKIQGLAYSKFGGIAGLTILTGWFLPEAYHWVFGLFPPFLVCKAYWMAYQGHSLWGLVLGLGVAVQVVLGLWFIYRFRAMVEAR